METLLALIKYLVGVSGLTGAHALFFVTLAALSAFLLWNLVRGMNLSSKELEELRKQKRHSDEELIEYLRDALEELKRETREYREENRRLQEKIQHLVDKNSHI